MRELPAKLQAARREDVRREDLPTLPAWYPADRPPTEDAPALVYTAETRAAARAEQAMTEARRGPMDGAVVMVACPHGPPETLAVHQGFTYRLAVAESKPDWLVYRYAPHLSPAHARTMREAVEVPYAEHGLGYVQDAQGQEAVTDATLSPGLLAAGRAAREQP